MNKSFMLPASKKYYTDHYRLLHHRFLSRIAQQGMEQKTDSEKKMEVRSKSIFEKETSDDGFRVCVMRFVKDYYKYDLWLRELAPSIELLNDYKNRKISWEEYEERYLKEIEKRKGPINKLIGLVKEKGVLTLLCAEKEDKYCHRRLLKEYLETLLV